MYVRLHGFLIPALPAPAGPPGARFREPSSGPAVRPSPAEGARGGAAAGAAPEAAPAAGGGAAGGQHAGEEMDIQGHTQQALLIACR